MGQHKHNPTAIAAKKGELPPKPKNLGKRDMDRLLYAGLIREMHKRGIPTIENLKLGLDIAPY